MLLQVQNWKRTLAAGTLGTLLLAPAALTAQEHVLSAADLQNQVRSAARQRNGNIARLQAFLASDIAAQAMRSAHVDAVRIRNAVPLLSDQELARITAQAADVQRDFAAGSLTHMQITLIIVGAIIIGLVAAIAAA